MITFPGLTAITIINRAQLVDFDGLSQSRVIPVIEFSSSTKPFGRRRVIIRSSGACQRLIDVPDPLSLLGAVAVEEFTAAGAYAAIGVALKTPGAWGAVADAVEQALLDHGIWTMGGTVS